MSVVRLNELKNNNNNKKNQCVENIKNIKVMPFISDEEKAERIMFEIKKIEELELDDKIEKSKSTSKPKPKPQLLQEPKPKPKPNTKPKLTPTYYQIPIIGFKSLHTPLDNIFYKDFEGVEHPVETLFDRKYICIDYLFGSCKKDECNKYHLCMFCLKVNLTESPKCRCEGDNTKCPERISCKNQLKCPHHHPTNERFLFLIHNNKNITKEYGRLHTDKNFCKVCYTVHQDKECPYFPPYKSFTDIKLYLLGIYNSSIIKMQG